MNRLEELCNCCKGSLTSDQKLRLLNSILESIEDWREYDDNADGPCMPGSVLTAMRILFPNGV